MSPVFLPPWFWWSRQGLQPVLTWSSALVSTKQLAAHAPCCPSGCCMIAHHVLWRTLVLRPSPGAVCLQQIVLCNMWGCLYSDYSSTEAHHFFLEEFKVFTCCCATLVKRQSCCAGS